MTSGWIRLAGLGCLALAIWLPRGLALDRLVTPDEPTWLTRSANFDYALAHGQLADTYQYVHPGVTVMWAGAAGFLLRYPSYAREAPGQLANEWRHPITDLLLAQGYAPLDLLVASRTVMVLLVTVVLTLAFLAARRLLGVWAALVGFLFIAVDPFHVALSRLLHLDGLVSSLMLLSLLALLNHLGAERRRHDLYLSAVAVGLACLTRSSALFLLPFAGLLFGLELLPRWWTRRRVAGRALRDGARSFLLWASVALGVFVAVWPAMWVDPRGSFVRLFSDDVIEWAQEGHDRAIFFAGANHLGDPGLAFYPVTYLWRTTPVVLGGLALAAVALLSPRARGLSPAQRRALLTLVLFTGLFTLAFTLGAKKFDRYVLPIYPALDLVAALGWLGAARWLWDSQRVVARLAAPALLALVVAVQAGGALATYPYYLTYYNPVLGGTPAAAEVMMIGWGEGLDQVADYLNAQPDAAALTVVTTAWPASLAYFFVGTTEGARLRPDAAALRQWATADYFVLYVNQVQREAVPAELLEYFAGLSPVLVVRLAGLEYASLYDVRDSAVPRYFLAGTASAPDQSLSAADRP